MDSVYTLEPKVNPPKGSLPCRPLIPLRSPSSSDSPSLTLQGRLLLAKVPMPGRKGGGLRGLVTHFSEASRRELMRLCACFDWTRIIEESIPFYFVTLTIPEELWQEGRRCFAALDKFRRYLSSKPLFRWAVVRRELGEKRGAVHYHLLVFGLPMQEARNAQCEVADKWTEFLGAAAFPGVMRNNGRVVVDIEKANDENVAEYLTKYCTKAAYAGRERPEAGARAVVAPLVAARAGSWSETHNGHRWWYMWGQPLFAAVLPEEFAESINPEKVLAYIRRTWRHVIKQRRVKAFLWQFHYQLMKDTKKNLSLRAEILGPQEAAYQAALARGDRDAFLYRLPARAWTWARKMAKREERDRRRRNWAGLWRRQGFAIMFGGADDGDRLIVAATMAAEACMTQPRRRARSPG